MSCTTNASSVFNFKSLSDLILTLIQFVLKEPLSCANIGLIYDKRRLESSKVKKYIRCFLLIPYYHEGKNNDKKNINNKNIDLRKCSAFFRTFRMTVGYFSIKVKMYKTGVNALLAYFNPTM